MGTQTAYLLDPLYVVLAASLLALVVRLIRGRAVRPLPRLIAYPAATLVLYAGLSLLWTHDLRAGSIELLFFLFPFSALVVAVVKSPFRRWHPRALAATLVALAALFSAVSLFQRLTAAGISTGPAFRAINKAGRIATSGFSPKVIWGVVKVGCSKCGLDGVAPHDLRRTCARLCHEAGGELEQIQFLLGHVSVQTTERYLGCKQRLRNAVNDRIGLEPATA